MTETRSGFAAVMGRPNVGKSTLINAILGQKVSIVSNKPQTTRNKILGIKTTANCQTIYIDTPGIHKYNGKKINKLMNKAAGSATVDADVIIFVIEAGTWCEEDELVLAKINKSSASKYLVINKMDKTKDKDELLPFIQKMATKADFADVVPMSALKLQAVTKLEALINARMQDGPFYFPEEAITDKSEQFQIAEIIREPFFRQLKQELPYSMAVEIIKMEQNKKLDIHAVVWVERDSQKAIIIGKGGQMLKRLGMTARKQLEEKLGKGINLQLWLKVRATWSDNLSLLQELQITG